MSIKKELIEAKHKDGEGGVVCWKMVWRLSSGRDDVTKEAIVPIPEGSSPKPIKDWSRDEVLALASDYFSQYDESLTEDLNRRKANKLEEPAPEFRDYDLG